MRCAGFTLAVLTRIPMAGRLPTGLHLPGSDAWLVRAAAADGRVRWAAGRDQSRGTAVVAAMAARTARGLAAGVHHLHQTAVLADIPSDAGITIGCLPSASALRHIRLDALDSAERPATD